MKTPKWPHALRSFICSCPHSRKWDVFKTDRSSVSKNTDELSKSPFISSPPWGSGSASTVTLLCWQPALCACHGVRAVPVLPGRASGSHRPQWGHPDSSALTRETPANAGICALPKTAAASLCQQRAGAKRRANRTCLACLVSLPIGAGWTQWHSVAAWCGGHQESLRGQGTEGR